MPLIPESWIDTDEFNLVPRPRKLFSFIEKATDPPLVPIPAPAEISPVGFSSTVILIIFLSRVSLSTTSVVTDLKTFVDFILLIVLLCRISLNASPSST